MLDPGWAAWGCTQERFAPQACGHRALGLSQEICLSSWRPWTPQTVFRPWSASKQTVPPDPHSSSQRVGGRHCVTTPTAHRCALAFRYSVRMPGCLRCPLSPAAPASSAPRSLSCCLRQHQASLPRWAVGVCDASTCGRRILLDLSGALQKWMRQGLLRMPGAAIYRSSRPRIFPPTWGCRLVPGLSRPWSAFRCWVAPPHPEQPSRPAVARFLKPGSCALQPGSVIPPEDGIQFWDLAF
jgi:hypothetical protein